MSQTKKRGPFFWLRTLGRVLIGRHDDPVDKSAASEKLAPPHVVDQAVTASLQFHTQSTLLVGSVGSGKKLHIAPQAPRRKTFLCGAPLATRRVLFNTYYADEKICKNCRARHQDGRR